MINKPFWHFRNPALTLLWLCILFYCLDFFFRISPSLIFNELLEQYHTSPLGMGAFSSAFYVGYLLFQIPTGILLDHCKLRNVIAIPIFLAIVSFIFFLTETHYLTGYILRLITGAASAFSFIGILVIAKQYFPLKHFTLIAGIAIGAGTVFASLIQLLSAALMQLFHWQLVFVFFSTLGFIILIAILLLPAEMKIEKPRISTPFSFKQIWIFTKNKKLIINACVGGLFYLPTTLFTTMWGVPFLQASGHFSLTSASLGITFLFAGWAIGSPIMGYFADKTPHFFMVILIGACCAGLTSIFLIYFPLPTESYLYTLLFLFGIFSSTQVVVWKIFNVHCPQAISGYGTAFTNMLMMLFASIFHVVVGFLMQYHFIGGGDSEFNYVQGLSIIPLCFFIVFILSAYLMISSKK